MELQMRQEPDREEIKKNIIRTKGIYVGRRVEEDPCSSREDLLCSLVCLSFARMSFMASPPLLSGHTKLLWLRISKMYLHFYINEKGDKVYTTKKESPLGLATQSAHPARFSPDDKYSRQRVLLKKRFGLLPTQKPAPKY
ncbi:hypothetical protein DM860_012597 [Cuscuta australis]|uniref:Nucleolar protein 10 n=1 Tax=Cuscuta australis TaxID=267555 RepID=A0A328DD75_9ASTE|nr:hypothetical protein DM860_012597 [Cuscuta australis]